VSVISLSYKGAGFKAEGRGGGRLGGNLEMFGVREKRRISRFG